MERSKGPLIDRDEAVLLIIDMQERLLPVIAEKESIVENVVRLVKFSHLIGLPVVLTEQEKLGGTLPEIREHLPKIQPVTKLVFDCFRSAPFVERLAQLDKATLIITGIEAHICVAQTALHALSQYTVHVVSDAVSSRSLHNWEVSLRRMRQQGITITSTEMVIYELLGEAGTDAFREVLKLVK